MALPSSFSSSSSSRSWRYNVFLSFHGPDVRTTFLSHLRKQFERNGIITFNDQEIERSQTIAPELTRAIQESRISILVLSQKYASSNWCLREMVEILKCKESVGQIVMTVFYKVNPSDVRKQIGEFGKAFMETCVGKVESEIQSWAIALTHVANIEGEHSLNWVNEADMIEKIAADVSNKLNATSSIDFDGMVGLEAHLGKMESLLHLENDGAMIVGISGPAGIGKTTIARALYNQLSSKFPLRHFMENVRGSYWSVECDEHGLKMKLQEQLLSKILDQNRMKISHLNVINERLHNQKVLIILDEVDNLEQLDACARDTSWFGPGSRIIVTTEDQKLLRQHDINNIYHVDFPSKEEALEIFCLSAFRKIYPPDDFGELAERAVELCSNLPLGLRVVGSSLRTQNKIQWEDELHRLETSLHRNIEKILRVGYNNLQEKDQALFLYIAVFFNYTKSVHLKSMLAGIDERPGLETLVDKSLVCIDTCGDITMHKLLQQMGTQEIRRQEPWKRHILIDADEICNVLEHAEGASTVMGISFDISKIDEVFVSMEAFRRVCNLQFLRVYSRRDRKVRVHIHEEIEFPRRLRLLHWEAYPSKSLTPRFHPEYLVELNFKGSKLEKLWGGTKPLTNLKKINLALSSNLKELPDLSNATKIESLDLTCCRRLVKIPSSYSNLNKLKNLTMTACKNLEVLPAHMNLESLEVVNIMGCAKLRNFPVISTNITGKHYGSYTVVGRIWSSLWSLKISKTQVTPTPLKHLKFLLLVGCKRLESLPEISTDFIIINASGCESLQRVPHSLHTICGQLNFSNCFKLNKEARRSIIQQSFLGCTTGGNGWACLPGRKVPSVFNHRARGNLLTIPPVHSNNPIYTFKLCVVISPNHQPRDPVVPEIRCRCISKGGVYPIDETKVYNERLTMLSMVAQMQTTFSTEHLFVFLSYMPHAMSNEILLEFSCGSPGIDIIKCGAQVWPGKNIRKKRKGRSNKKRRKKDKTHGNLWSWLSATSLFPLLVFSLSTSSVDLFGDEDDTRRKEYLIGSMLSELR